VKKVPRRTLGFDQFLHHLVADYKNSQKETEVGKVEGIFQVPGVEPHSSAREREDVNRGALIRTAKSLSGGGLGQQTFIEGGELGFQSGGSDLAVRRESGRGESRSATGFARQITKAESAVIEGVREESGIDISSHRPEDLEVIDQHIDERLRETLRHGNAGYERATLALGSYLGEVIVRNLGGEWHFPRFHQLLGILISRDGFKADKYWFVVSGGEEIHVFDAARKAIEDLSNRSSLSGFYHQLAHESSAEQQIG
jgi:hypothetical protein